MPLKAVTTTYEYSLEELEIMFAQQLEVDRNQIYVDYVVTVTSDDRFGGSAHYQLSSVKVTVRNKV